jgi:hypothetical protein
MRYFPQFSKVLLIANDLVKHNANYSYSWQINLDHLNIITLTGRKIYVKFDSLGVKHILLSVKDNSNGMISQYETNIYITQPIIAYKPIVLPTLVLNNGITGAFFRTIVQ